VLFILANTKSLLNCEYTVDNNRLYLEYLKFKIQIINPKDLWKNYFLQRHCSAIFFNFITW